jgi:hypothetical protein
MSPPDNDAVISAVGTTRPTTRPAHTLTHFIKTNSYAAASGFILFSGCNPTDPFIARQWRDIRPHLRHNQV